MIEQAGNHPSVFAWSVCNESATSTPGGRAFVKAMVEHVKALDPGRYVSYADDGLARVQDAAQNANQHTDFIMMNQYFGSWAGPAEGLAPALERVRRMFPDKMVVISEFSLAGLFAPDTAQADRMRALIMESQLAEFARHDFVAGAVFWCYQDYKSHRNLWPGLTSDWVEMGLVDEYRQRLPSYAAWQERTSPARAVVQGGWPATSSREIRLALRVRRPTGFTAAERMERWWEPRSGGLSPEEAKKKGLPSP